MLDSLSDVSYLTANISVKTLTAGKSLAVYFPLPAPLISCQFTYILILLKYQLL